MGHVGHLKCTSANIITSSSEKQLSRIGLRTLTSSTSSPRKVDDEVEEDEVNDDDEW